MKISKHILNQYTSVPKDPHELRMLLDDIGLEVKKIRNIDTSDGKDTVFDLEILANRGDHCSYLGIARELHGRTGDGINLPDFDSLKIGHSMYPLTIETDLCLGYMLSPMEICNNNLELPDKLFSPLYYAEVNRISPPVDITNLVNIEFGQPTHVFDADTIEGPIVIRLSVDGEKARPLFLDKVISLPVGTLVVADNVKVLAIAGIIGCEESKITKNSRNILLESAVFDPVSIRKTSRALGIRTDSSYRFERGGDPALIKVGSGRVVKLMRDYCGATLIGDSGFVGSWADPCKYINFSLSDVDNFLGISLSKSDVCNRLERYNFIATQKDDTDNISVKIPPGRLWDVKFSNDIYEELSKSIGYNNFPTTLPLIDLGGSSSSSEKTKETVEEVLIGYGFYEVLTDGFYGMNTINGLELPQYHILNQHVKILGSIDKSNEFLKNNGLLQLLAGVAESVCRRDSMVKAYEWTRTFHPNESAVNGFCNERHILACIISGQLRSVNWNGCCELSDSWFLKGVLFEINKELQIQLKLSHTSAESHPLSIVMHPGRYRTITLNDKIVGILGEIHPNVCRNMGIKRQDVRPCYLEIEVSALESKPVVNKYMNFNDHNIPTSRSLSFSMPLGVSAEDVLNIIKSESIKDLLSVDVVDEYIHSKSDNRMRTLTFELLWSNSECTLTTDDLNKNTDKVRQIVENNLKSSGVYLRQS